MFYKFNVKNLIAVGFFIFTATFCCAQTFELKMLSNSKPTNLRGLSVVDSLTVWTCGSDGYVGKSTNGGITWQWVNPITYEKSDFRDVHAFSADTAIIMAAGTPALILRTTDGGVTWYESFSSNNKDVFLDAIDFWDSKKGVCIGDWLNQRPYNLETNDGGKSWVLQNFDAQANEDEKVAYFAASGTCLRAINIEGDTSFMAVGSFGNEPRLFFYGHAEKGAYDFELAEIPYKSVEPSEGIFSVAVDMENELIWLVGGDYAKPENGFCTVLNLDDEEFFLPKNQLGGYRSCVEIFKYNTANMVIACGTTGADVSFSDVDNANWQNISQLPLNTAKKARKGNTVFLCGKQGTIYKLVVK